MADYCLREGGKKSKKLPLRACTPKGGEELARSVSVRRSYWLMRGLVRDTVEARGRPKERKKRAARAQEAGSLRSGEKSRANGRDNVHHSKKSLMITVRNQSGRVERK